MKKSAFFLLVCMVLLFTIGLLMVFNTTSAEVLNRDLKVSTHHAFFKQLFYGCFSLMAGLTIYFFGYRKLLQISPYLFYITLGLLICVFIPKIGMQVNGAHRWIAFGPFIVGQPSELMKVIMPLYFLFLFLRKKEEMTWKRFYCIMALFSIALFLILLEPDNGTVVILMVTMIALFFLTRIPLAFWLFPLLVIGAIAIGCAMHMPHVKERIHVYLNPELDLLGKGHQPYQSKIAVGSGGIWGRGVGESLQKLNYLPEARSDYIAAIYAEEFGFVGMFFLILLYMILTYLGFHIAAYAQDKGGYYLATIMTFLVAFQAFINLGVVSGLLPNKGTNLPFFSQGGSSLLANTVALSLILHVAMSEKVKAGKKKRRQECQI